MKPYAKILQTIDTDFENALSELRSDPIFLSQKNVYTLDDKNRIARIWIDILWPFKRLRWIIHSLSFRSFLTFRSKNSFVVKYVAVVTYYNMVHDLQQVFWLHEEFLRQYLDDTFSENYSTLARFIYHIRFYALLFYPREYFLTLQDEVDRSLAPLFARRVRAAGDIEKRFSHDRINIWYYIRYRMSLVFSWISRHGGRMMMHVHLTRRETGLIRHEHIERILLDMEPGDVILTRQNWAATNLNIPWFWKHMAMYIGTGMYLKNTYTLTSIDNFRDDEHYCIESIGLWVRIIPFEMLWKHNDYLAVIRPRFSQKKKMRAIEKTLWLIGRAYDYTFNYYSDKNYVCSTLVTKAYLPESDTDEWIHITLTRIGTGITYPPNDIVKKFREDNATERQELDFVGFIDSSEKRQENFISTQSEFLATATRPRLSFFLP